MELSGDNDGTIEISGDGDISKSMAAFGDGNKSSLSGEGIGEVRQASMAIGERHPAGSGNVKHKAQHSGRQDGIPDGGGGPMRQVHGSCAGNA